MPADRHSTTETDLIERARQVLPAGGFGNFATDTRVGIPAQVTGHPANFDVVFTDRPVRNYRDILASDAGRLTRFNAILRRHGVLKSKGKFYISLAHDDVDVAQTVKAIRSAADEMKSDP